MNDFELSTKEAQIIIIRECGTEYSITGVRNNIYRKKIKAQKRLGRLFISRSSLMQFVRAKKI